MLVDMGIVKRIHDMDCIAVDGAYTQHIGALLEKEDGLDIKNFAFPIRKKRSQPLHPEEATFNAAFGGFRSMVENTFADFMRTFFKHNNLWMDSSFDYPREKKLIPELTETYTVQHKLERGAELLKLQEEFLGMDVSDDDEGMGDVRQVLTAVEIPMNK
ncbi:hypothetical protein BGZ82_003033 [Podila clonocystis]|nr:hypothetical protein BGZ82_003033 [Podila clonocystis]